MATFYVLPSRFQVGQRFGELLTSMFPRADGEPFDLAESLSAIIERQQDAHVVYREDLDERMSVKDALLRHFGAELHDEIIEIQFGPGLNQYLHQPWATESARNAA